MHNYEKYGGTLKAEGLFLSTDIAKISGLPLEEVQTIAKLLNVKKDGARIYIFTKKDVARFLKFLLLRDESS